MKTSACLEVGRADFRDRTRMITEDVHPAGPGEVVFVVERFGLTANNLTYAVLGDALDYWAVFPAEPGWGRIPAWACLRAADDSVPGVEAGSRFFGLSPMATHVVLRPGRVRPTGFTEQSDYRARVPAVYNGYVRIAAGPDGPGVPGDDISLVLRPVFWLSFTLDRYLARSAPGRPVIVTSASSKAAIGLARLLSARGVAVTGLTSERNREFVRSLGPYTSVRTYDRLGQAMGAGAVLIDIAGSASLRASIRAQAAGRLAEVIVAGAASGEAATGADHLFFAPDHIWQLTAELGWLRLEQQFEAELAGFIAASPWLALVRHEGPAGIAEGFRQVLDQAGSPADAHLVVPHPAAAAG